MFRTNYCYQLVPPHSHIQLYNDYPDGRVLMGESHDHPVVTVSLISSQRTSDVTREGNTLCTQHGHGMQALTAR